MAEIELLRFSEMEDTDYVLAQDSAVRREIRLPVGDEEGHSLDKQAVQEFLPACQEGNPAPYHRNNEDASFRCSLGDVRFHHEELGSISLCQRSANVFRAGIFGSG